MDGLRMSDKVICKLTKHIMVKGSLVASQPKGDEDGKKEDGSKDTGIPTGPAGR